MWLHMCGMCVWRPEVNLRCCSSGATHIYFIIRSVDGSRVSFWSGAVLAGQTGWAANHRDTSVSTPPLRPPQRWDCKCTWPSTALFHQFWGSNEFRFSSLHSSTVSPAAAYQLLQAKQKMEHPSSELVFSIGPGIQ